MSVTMTMRKFGNQPLVPTNNSFSNSLVGPGSGPVKVNTSTSTATASKTRATRVPSSVARGTFIDGAEPDDNADGIHLRTPVPKPQPVPPVQGPPRRMKAFGTPKLLTTPLVPETKSTSKSTDEDEEDGEAGFSAYATFLAASDRNGGGEPMPKTSTSTRKSTAAGGAGARKALPSSIGARRGSNSTGTSSSTKFNAPLLPPPGSGPSSSLLKTDGQDAAAELLRQHQEKQRASYLKTKRVQPFLVQDTQNGFTNHDEGDVDVIITKSFKPLSRRSKDTATDKALNSSQTYLETSSSAFDTNREELDRGDSPRTFIRHSDGFGQDLVIEKAKTISFDFVGSARGQRRRAKPEESPDVVTKESKAERSRKLARMLRLDPCSVELFRLNELDYEKYMSTARTQNCRQVSTQTFDDGMEESTQTETIYARTKWTQKPTGWDWNKENVMNKKVKSSQSALGVGDDTVDTSRSSGDRDKEGEAEAPENDEDSAVASEERQKLNKFLHKSCSLMLAVLSSQKSISTTGKIGPNSKNLVKLKKGLTFVQDLASYHLYTEGELIASCNTSEARDSIVTIWTWKEPTFPLYFLRVFSPVTALEINSTLGLVVLGCKDASINCYNLLEHYQYHEQDEGQTIRSPSINTGCWEELNHESQITGLAIVPETKNCAQIISLDREKLLICWSLFLHTHQSSSSSEGVPVAESVWSKLKLKIRTKTNLLSEFSRPALKLLSLRVWQPENSADVHLAIATNAGFIGKGLLRGGSIIPPSNRRGNSGLIEMYDGGLVPSAIVSVTSFDLQMAHELMLAGYDDGYCRLFRFGKMQPILVFNCNDPPIKVRWSKLRNSVFYIGYANRMEVWDILQSDIVPDHSIKMELKDFEVFGTKVGELIAILTPDSSLSIGSPPGKIEPLSSKDDQRLQMYIKIVT